MQSYKLFLLLFIFISSCDSAEKTRQFAEKIENSHKKSAIQSKVIQYDFKLSMGGSERLNAIISVTPDLSRIKMETDSVTLLYDGRNVFKYPGDVAFPGARFTVFTWPYFFTLPYKLTDPGTIWSDFPDDTIQNIPYEIQKLSFKPGTGDSPDDWYIVYADTSKYRLHAAAYIVTYNKSQQEAEKEPHAVIYKNYKNIEGIPVSTEWDFTLWSKNSHFGQIIGHAKLSNITLLNDVDAHFQIPKHVNKKRISAPQ